ncbi:Exonuclease, RNase T/DNA polymerase III [Penicillium expansum]|uniref:Exonuclease, RNase T/DNA polymerase III n=1 Tax=Penicillium expansum TaxID=27334 RepID=A0A0A2K407_PENEN|nr:Exonuclease, RNase T/DNA polymerase III [Penicillium expansum]KGO36145.1 Exonuclease, RNase T/DNA polymerase III [Penicillium expansum]KGO38517.1 Exonuclease, RNase T/DNA polymerase III [Penicillium expansum]KGO61781.1 Exonuclease, RNase T/DNA polymerase III [Penicillium expansum]
MNDSNPTQTEHDELLDRLLDKIHTEEQLGVIQCNEFAKSPMPKENTARRKVLALDCEMVGVEDGRKELAFLVVLDVLTGEVLINNFVNPINVVRNWHTRWSGITCSDMKAAVRENIALRGWRAARASLFEYMDHDTILVGHALQNDLNALGVLHSTVIDTAILTADAVYGPLARPFRRTWSLKALAKDFLGHEIQAGKNGHSALEDTLATRDVLVFCTKNPLEFETWADKARSEEPPVKPEEPEEECDESWFN